MRSLLTAAAISLAFTLFLTPVFLRWFRKWGWGQVIRTPENVHNPSHGAKRGTPTMGGTIFILGTMVGYFIGSYAGNNPPTISGLLVLWLMLGFGVVVSLTHHLGLLTGPLVRVGPTHWNVGSTCSCRSWSWAPRPRCSSPRDQTG